MTDRQHSQSAATLASNQRKRLCRKPECSTFTCEAQTELEMWETKRDWLICRLAFKINHLKKKMTISLRWTALSRCFHAAAGRKRS